MAAVQCAICGNILRCLAVFSLQFVEDCPIEIGQGEN